MDDLLREFLTETAENLAVLDAELVQFEHNPHDGGILGNIFRLVHTIKGTCGFLGLSRLEGIAHAGENVLGKFRDGDLAVSPPAVTAILKCIDAIREVLAALEETGAEPAGDDDALLAELAAIVASGNPAPPLPVASSSAVSLPAGSAIAAPAAGATAEGEASTCVPSRAPLIEVPAAAGTATAGTSEPKAPPVGPFACQCRRWNR